jgi:hypothetical protein
MQRLVLVGMVVLVAGGEGRAGQGQGMMEARKACVFMGVLSGWWV